MRKFEKVAVFSLVFLAGGVTYWQLAGKGTAEPQEVTEMMKRDARGQRLRDREDLRYWLEDCTSKGEYSRPKMREDFAKIIGRPLLRNPQDFFEMIDAQDGIPAKAELSDEALAYLALGETGKAIAILQDRPYLWNVASSETKALLVENAVKYAGENGVREALGKLPESIRFDLLSRIGSEVFSQFYMTRDFSNPPKAFLFGDDTADGQILITVAAQGAMPNNPKDLQNWIDYTGKRKLKGAESQLLRMYGRNQGDETLKMLRSEQKFNDSQKSDLLLGVAANDTEKALRWSAKQPGFEKQTPPLYERWLDQDAAAASEWLLSESGERQKELGKLVITYAERAGDKEGATEWRKIVNSFEKKDRR